MGIIRNIALKTAIKKALLDVTKEIESHGKTIPQASSFGEMVMAYARNHPSVDKESIEDTWEATFFRIVMSRAQAEMPSSYLIQSQKELFLFISLVTEWVAMKEGDANNIHGPFEEFFEDYNQAIRLDPNNAKAFLNRGLAYYDIGQYQQAIEDYNQSISLAPNNAQAYLNRGLSYVELDKYQQAIEDFNQAIRLDPTDSNVYYNRGLAYHFLGQYQQAIEDYSQSISLDPKNAYTYYFRGDAYYKLNKYERAIKDFNQAIHFNSKHANAYYSLGFIYSLQNNISKALKNLELALENGFDDFDCINKDADWDNIRSTKEFNELIDKYKK
jgi:tetratricopeptide (TPR) repeat protein